MSVAEVQEQHVRALKASERELVLLAARYGISDIRVLGVLDEDDEDEEEDALTTLFAKVAPNRTYFDVGAFLSRAQRVVSFPLDLVIEQGRTDPEWSKRMVSLAA